MSSNANEEKSSNSFKFSRREFIGTMAAASAFTIIPRSVMGGPGYTAPSDLPNIAGIGIGSQGGSDIRQMCTPEVEAKRDPSTNVKFLMQRYGGIQPKRREFKQSDAVVQTGDAGKKTFKYANIYALCDVDTKYAGFMFASYPKAKQYTDWREMLDKEKEIDGVVIGTPDHNHAIIATHAMAAGKAVFVEKPMAKTIYEVRYLRDMAKKTGMITQMGNQGHNIEGTMRTMEWIKAGAIGDVKEVHMWSNRPVWPQGYLTRPEAQPVPDNLNFDLWLGPAPKKGYNPDTTHFNWRGLWDYGTGAMGDMGAHTFDAPIRALGLGMPIRIQATTTPYNDEFLPLSEFVTYTFKNPKGSGEITVTWSDGGIKPARPKELEADRELREALYIGTKGMLMHGTHGANPELIPNRDYSVKPTLERPDNIYKDFCDAIREHRKAKNDFEFAAKLTEIMLLTNIAVASQQINTELIYDAENMKITNCEEANKYFSYQYRDGWELAKF